jgi:hypothetical protein
MRIILITALCAFVTLPATADEWTFSVKPYILAASIEGNAGMGRVTGVDVDVDFSTILETLEMAAMINFEAQSGNGWGFAIDYGFMDLSDDFFGSRGGVVDMRVRQGVLEGLLIRQSRNEASGLEYFAGFRWWDNDLDVAFDPVLLPGTAERKIDASWIDLLVGARWTRDISDRWQMQLRGDVGGFGIEADFTSALSASFLYRFSQTFSLDLQYRAMWVDYEEGTSGQPGYFAYDTVTHGPIVGLKIEF